MKKAMAVILSALLLCLSACGGESASGSEASSASSSAESTKSKSSSTTSEFLETITAETAEEKGVCGADLTWYYQDNVLVIKGTGPMVDYLVELQYFSNEVSETSVVPPWFEFRNEIGTVVIDDGCTSIGDYAFLACGTLASVDLPDHLETIGNYAFNSCTNLRNVALPGGVVKIGDGAFSGCKMDTLTLPDTLEYIGEYGLAGCTELTELTIPASVKTLSSDVFDSCENIDTITFAGDAPEGLYGYIRGLKDTVTVYYNGSGFEQIMEHNPDLNWVKQP